MITLTTSEVGLYNQRDKLKAALFWLIAAPFWRWPLRMWTLSLHCSLEAPTSFPAFIIKPVSPVIWFTQIRDFKCVRFTCQLQWAGERRQESVQKRRAHCLAAVDLGLSEMLGMCHPRPGMRFSSHLLLFSSHLTGDYGVDVALRSVGLPKPWRYPLCNRSRTNWGKIIQTSQSCLLFTLQFLMIQDKNVSIEVLAVEWAKCDQRWCQNPEGIGETRTATM